MSLESNNQDQSDLESNSDNNFKQKPTLPKKRSNIILKLSILILVLAIVFSGYIEFSFQKVSYNKLQSQLSILKSDQVTTDNLLSEVNTKTLSQAVNVKSLQSQIDYLNTQVDVPTKDIHKQISISSIQSAISYLVLAKDVAMFGGDVSKSQSLVDTAFDKIEASRIATISAKDRINVTESIKMYASKKSVVSEFMNVQSQFSGLHYLTPESIPKKPLSTNKYLNLLRTMVEVQDIPNNQVLVSTTHSKLYVVDELYNSLLSFQRAMYANDESSIQSNKSNLLKIVHKYFVQDASAKRLETAIEKIHQQSSAKLVSSLDKIITSLATQQNILLANTNSNSLTEITKRGAK